MSFKKRPENLDVFLCLPCPLSLPVFFLKVFVFKGQKEPAVRFHYCWRPVKS